MTTSAQHGKGNFPESFAASGLSIEEAERLAAAFKPSWEFDEAPFTQGGAMDAAEMDRLAAGGVHSEIRGRDERGSGHSRAAAPHAPPPRVETHEPEVSVIIDRSITAQELAAHAPLAAAPPPAPIASAFAPHAIAAPVMPPPTVPRRVVAAPSPDDSIEIPGALKKSNKGLFLGLGGAVLAAVLVLAVRAATSSSEGDAGAASATATAATATAPTQAALPIPPPPPVATAAATAAATPAPTTPPAATPAPQPHVAAPAPAPRPEHAAVSHERPHAAPAPAPRPHAPKSTNKPASGGIVRDVPF